MEKIYFEYKDTLRNRLIDLIRLLSTITFFLFIFALTPFQNGIIAMIIPLIIVALLFFPRKLKVVGYYDAIGFRKKSLHWDRTKDFAILFEKIERIEVHRIKSLSFLNFMPGLKEIYPVRLILHLNNRKQVRQLMLLKKNDTFELKDILDKKRVEFNYASS